jgi:hypothetical protein
LPLLKEWKALSEVPVLRAERFEFVAPVECAEAVPALPNECHWPSLIAGRIFDDSVLDEPALRLGADPPRL